MSYKLEHQRFMSGHSGTHFSELVWLLSSVCLTSILRDTVILLSGGGVGVNNISISFLNRFFTDFAILALLPLLILTLLSSNVFLTFSSLVILVVFLISRIIKRHTVESLRLSLHDLQLNPRKRFVTYFRSIVTLTTAIAILAVDFQVFPRKFAKTEEYGFGLMDIGVGFFVISNAIVSPEAQGKKIALTRSLQIKRAFLSSLPLFILGLARLLSVKGTDYQEHVTEYGVHWNFFFTLVVLKLSCSTVFCVVPSALAGVAGVLIIGLHQYYLTDGLSSYIIEGSDGMGGRNSFIDANREGIFSFPGYIGLYMLGVQLGRFIFNPRINLQEWKRAAVALFVTAISMAMVTHAFHYHLEKVSRRFMNAAYVTSTMSLSCISLSICLVGDITRTYCQSLGILSSQGEQQANEPIEGSFPENESTQLKRFTQSEKELCLFQAISLNSLLFFLLANLLTGCVNMCMFTIHASTSTAIMILTVYLFSLCLVSVILYSKGVKTKIW